MALSILPAEERRISRKLTVNVEQTQVNVRPVIKGKGDNAIVEKPERFINFVAHSLLRRN